MRYILNKSKVSSVSIFQKLQFQDVNFGKLPFSHKSHSLKYDFESVMHYPMHAFAMDASKATVVPKDPKTTLTRWIRNRLSKGDKCKLQMAYCGELERFIDWFVC